MVPYLFLGFAAMLLATALMVILHKHPVTSALFLVLSFSSLAGIYLLLQAEFIGMVQIIVYAGAIMVLFLFVIMLLDLKEEEKRHFIATRENAERLQSRATKESYKIASVTKKEVRRSAPPPFTTSTLQQDAGRRLRFSTKKAMDVAQKLYEGVELGSQGLTGLITYMRTDSIRVSDEAVGMAQEFIYENFGKEYLPKGAQANKKTAIKKKGDAKVQDAHEAIRPTNLKITPKEARKHLDRDLAAL